MQVNFCLPFLLGTKVTQRVPGQLEMTVVVRGVYRLAPGEPVAPIDDMAQLGLQGDIYSDGDDDRTGALVHASDFADFKLKTDVLLRGTCYPGTGGRAAQVCTVRFAVGDWSRSLRVSGRRVWTERAFDPISEPAPFAAMPITYENAFGGPELPANPVGKGYRTAELPTVEDPAALLRGRRDTPEPASFGPLSPTWPQRSSKLGTDYGKTWKKTRAPFYAADFDWSHFNAAPAEQQLPGYLRGDEPLLFEYLHPKAIRFTAGLPGVRPRVLCRRTDGFTTEVPMNLDTLVADLDGERLVLLWRGLARVNDDQLDDVRTLFVGCEPLAEPKPAKHYLAELEALDADPVGYMRDRLVPAETKRKIEEARAAAAQATEAAPRPDQPPKPKEPVARLEALLGEQSAGATPEQAGQKAALLAKLKAFYQESEGKLPGLKAQAAADGAVTPTSAGILAAAATKLSAGKATAAAAGLPTERFEVAEKQLAEAKEQHDAAEAARAAAGPAEAPGAPAAPGPGANLMERDLSGWDLRGADLRGALLRKAKLVRAKLAGANLTGADLGDTDLEGADFTGADLTQAVLSGARAPGATFAEATLARTIFAKTDLTGASLAGARGAMCAFQEATLVGARLPGIRLFKAIFAKARLDAADFGGAELDTCCFLEVSAPGARFDEAHLPTTSFLRSNLTGASFYQASGEGCSWQGSTLDGADFRFGKLRRAQFNKATLDHGKLHAADFRGGRFERASLAEADFSKADLMSVSFNKARLSATNFEGASLHDAKFLGAIASVKCNFTGANLTRAIWEQP